MSNISNNSLNQIRVESVPFNAVSPTHCLLASPHPKGFVIVIIPESISIKIIPDGYLPGRLDSFFRVHHLLCLTKKGPGPKRRRAPSLLGSVQIRLTPFREI